MRRSNNVRLSAIPTAAGGIARAAYALALTKKMNPEPLLKPAGLNLKQVENPNARIGVKNQIAFLNMVADALRDESLGFRLAKRLDLRELGLLYYVPASSEQLGAAMRKVARYSSIHNEGVKITLREGSSMSVTFEYVDVARRDDRHQIEFFAVTLVRIARQLTGRGLMPARVCFIHRRNDIPADFKAFFGSVLAFGQDVDEIAFPAMSAQIPIASADPYLNALLLKYLEEATTRRRYRPSDWRLKVENAIVPLLPHGQAQLPEVANRLGLSQRTLARRLQEEGLTFIELLDDLRYKLAERYLQEGDLPATEIAWLLGYSEPSSFSHAFKRWTGTTAGERRRSARAD